MTRQGKIYFYACHMLYTAMQMYYEFEETTTLNMRKVADQYAKWNPIYHEIMGWSLEEIVFPFDYENLSSGFAKVMGDIAEAQDEKFYSEAYETIIAFGNHSSELHSLLEKESVVYFCYCLFLARVLKTFGSIMNTESMRLTAYAQHYRDAQPLINDLLNLLENERSMAGELIETAFTEVEKVSNDLQSLWNNSVYSALDQLQG